jgi:hypothetical protein
MFAACPQTNDPLRRSPRETAHRHGHHHSGTSQHALDSTTRRGTGQASAGGVEKIIQMDEGTNRLETHPAKMKVAVLILFMLAVAGPSAAVNAQSSPQSPPASTNADVGQQRIDEVFTKPHITPDVFAASYIEHNSQAKVEGIVKDLKSTLGDYKSVKKSMDKNDPPFDTTWERYTAVFAKGVDDVYIHFDDSGKVDALTFRAPRPGGT